MFNRLAKAAVRKVLRFKPVREALDEELGSYFNSRNNLTLR